MAAPRTAPAPWLDRAIAVFSPQRALARYQARAKISRLTLTRNLYEGAAQSRRTQGWRSFSTDANSEIRSASGRLRDVAREMVRNSAIAARAEAVVAHNVVGAGIVSNVKAATTSRKDKITALLKKHFDTTDIDADGKLNLYGLQDLIMKTIVESGEVIIRKRLRRVEDGYALPFQIQVLEPDFLDTFVDGQQPNGNWACQGVEFDLRGKPVAYFLYDQHPGSMQAGAIQTRGSRITADFVTHVYRIDRPGQVRGVTWFAPVMVRMRDYADYVDAQLIRQKVAACLAAFITTDEGATGPDGGVLPIDPASGAAVETLTPGMISRLRSGESITFNNPPTTADFAPYSTVTLREIAAGIGVTYEALTNDYSNVNFSSGRMGWLEFYRNVESWQWNMLIPQGLDKIAGWTREAAYIVTGSTEPFDLEWTPPARDMINPVEEIEGSKSAIRSGLSSRSNEVRKRGLDPAELDAEIAEDNRRADAAGLQFDSDPRFMTSKGVSQKNADPNAPDDPPPAQLAN